MSLKVKKYIFSKLVQKNSYFHSNTETYLKGTQSYLKCA